MFRAGRCIHSVVSLGQYQNFKFLCDFGFLQL